MGAAPLIVQLSWLMARAVLTVLLLHSLRLVRVLLVVICRLDVYDLIVDYMTVTAIDLNQLDLVLLGLLHRVKVHLDEAKTTASLSLPVAHDYGVRHLTELLEVVDEVTLLSHECKAADEQFHLVLGTFQLESMRMSRATRHEHIAHTTLHATIDTKSADHRVVVAW